MLDVDQKFGGMAELSAAAGPRYSTTPDPMAIYGAEPPGSRPRTLHHPAPPDTRRLPGSTGPRANPLRRCGSVGGVGLQIVRDRVVQRTKSARSEEHTSELQSLMRISYAVFCLKKKKKENKTNNRSTKTNKAIHCKHIKPQDAE